MPVAARNNYLTEAQKEVMKSFDAGWKGFTPVYEEVFNVERGPMRLEEKFSVRGGMSPFNAVTEGAGYNQQNPKIVGTQTISELVYKEAVAITKMMKAKDHYGSAMEDAKRLGYYARHQMDKLAADLLADATGATVTWDGLALGHASHLIGDTGSIQSNLTTGGLSTSNVKAAYEAFMLQKDHNNRVMGIAPVAIVVPVRNMTEIHDILESQKEAETANNRTNMFLTNLGLKIIAWPQLVTTDFEAMLLGPKSFTRLEYLIHYGPDLTPDRDTATGNDLVQLDLSCNAGAIDYLGTHFITA